MSGLKEFVSRISSHVRNKRIVTHPRRCFIRFFRAVRKRWGRLISLSSLLVLILATALAYVEATHKVIVLELVTVPKQLSDAGLTSEVVTERVREELKEIETSTEPVFRDKFVTRTDPYTDQLTTTLAQNLADIEIPDAHHHTLSFFIDHFRHLLNTDPVHLSGEVVIGADKMQVSVKCRALKRSEPQRVLPERTAAITDGDAIVSSLARSFAEIVNPFTLGRSLARGHKFAEAAELSDNMLYRGEDDDDHYAEAHLIKALIGALSNDYPVVDREVSLAQQLAPHNWDVSNSAGYIYLVEHHADEAVTVLKETARLSPDRCEPFTNLGAAYFFLHQLSDAEANFRVAIDKSDACSAAHSNLATILALEHNLKDSEEEYKRAIHLEPSSADAHNAFGIFLEDLGRTSEAQVEMRRAIALRPNEAVYHANLGRALHLQGDETASAAEINKAFGLQAESAMPHRIFGIDLTEQHKMDEAKQQFQTSVALDPRDAGGYVWLSYISLVQRNYGDVLKQTAEAIQLDSGSSRAYAYQGQAWYALGNFDGAENDFTNALKFDPDDAIAIIGMAGVWLSRAQGTNGEPPYNAVPMRLAPKDCADRASQLLDRALTLEPNSIDALDEEGTLLELRGRWVDAIDTYRRAISSDSSFAEPHIRLGIVLAKSHRDEEAIGEFLKASSLDEELLTPRVDLAQLYFNTGQYQGALATLDRAKNLKDDGRVHYWKGMTLLSLRKNREAIAELEVAVKMMPLNATGHHSLAIAYKGIGKAGFAAHEDATAHMLNPREF